MKKHTPTTLEQAALQNSRNKLRKSVDAFNRKAPSFLDLEEEDDDDSWQIEDPVGSQDIDDGHDSDTSDEEEGSTHLSSSAHHDEVVYPENLVLLLPSNLAQRSLDSEKETRLKAQEEQLRVAQMNDALQQLRIALASKAFRLRNDVRHSKSTAHKTRAWAGIDKDSAKASTVVAGYHRARSALVRLKVAGDTLNKYQLITKSQLKMHGDITEENRAGQRNDRLPWFWRLDNRAEDELSTGALRECEKTFFSNWLVNLLTIISSPGELVSCKG